MTIILLIGVLALVFLLICTDRLIPRGELDATRTFRDQLEELAPKSALVEDLVTVTQAGVLDRLPRWMVADFDCPDRGPHQWREVKTSYVAECHYEFCVTCTRRRKVEPCLDTRDPLEVIYGLQFRR